MRGPSRLRVLRRRVPADGDNVANVDRLDLATGAWSSLSPLPAARSDLAAVSTDDAVLFIGGLTATFVDADSVYRLR